MTKTGRSDALKKLITDVSDFRISHQQYFDDLEPQWWYDAALTGKVKSLVAFCRALGWTELVAGLEGLFPIQGNAPSTLDQIQAFFIPAIMHLIEEREINASAKSNQMYWDLIHPRIRHLARPRFERGFNGDAVESSLKEVNDVIKQYVKGITEKDLDGNGLMTFAFKPSSPVIQLENSDTDTARNVQQGYMQIFAGAMTGIRNPNAHGNLSLEPGEALHLIALASLLMTKFDGRVA